MNNWTRSSPSSLRLPDPATLLGQVRAERRRREAERERQRIAHDAEAIRIRCATLAGFVREAWHVLEPNTTLVWNWHLDALCAHLEAITYGKINRLLANVPPGSSKSLIVSVLWQAWEWGPAGLPAMRYLATAFNDGPVKRDTRKCRDLILSEWYRSLWPVTLTRTGEMSFANNQTGTREGIAFGSLTSQRGDRLIIDDPHSTETAESAPEREATTRKFREGALNRLNDQERSAIVVIMQRLHEDDISGVILKLGMEYTHLCLPMEFEPERRCVTPIFRDPRTGDGELLDPERFPRATVEKLKRDMGSYAYAGQYQQRPSPREGGLFKRHWFEFVLGIPAGPRQSVRGWDLAASKSTSLTSGPAFTAGVQLTEVAGTYYIEHAIRERGGPADVEKLIRNTASQDGAGVRISIPQDPGQAAKGQVLAFAKLLAGYVVRFSPESGDKVTRAEPVSAQAEVGNIKIVRRGNPDRDAWIEPFLEELCLFPSGAFKDQTDALSRAFSELLLLGRGRQQDIGIPLQGESERAASQSSFGAPHLSGDIGMPSGGEGSVIGFSDFHG